MIRSYKAEVLKAHPHAVCVRFLGAYEVWSDLYGFGKLLARESSSRAAWLEAWRTL